MPKKNAISRRELITLAAGTLSVPLFGQGHPEVSPIPGRPHDLAVEPSLAKRVTLEMSLKPFRSMDPRAIRSICEHVFRQWAPLLRRVDEAAVMLWTADGSEILTYRGRMRDEIEWGRYIGSANPPQLPPSVDPAQIDIHDQARLYIDQPAKITYGDLALIVRTLKDVGRASTGKPVTVGATFDPGPEFARSPFKYQKHAEIMKGYWVDCSASLNGDTEVYAGFPRGIPDRTPFGAFFGRQTQHFLTDLGFDYIWFSNGFGFSVTAWSVKGALFDGNEFHLDAAAGMREKILEFWRTFRKECPSFRVECRGSNLSTGADLSASASPIGDIYDGGFNMTAPPNSPWAAIDGDFGLEVSGYLSHIAHLPPGDRFPFRFYTHDPWWANSPWLDRYGREPHDIYLPLALARVNGRAQITRPSYIEFLTIDSSYGELPDQCPNEIIPHMLTGLTHYSDEPGLLTWVYPFRENHELVFGASPRPSEVFFGDWFMRAAVNAGLPLNTVVSTENFLTSLAADAGYYRGSVLLARIPEPGSALEKTLLEQIDAGQAVFFFGSVAHASPRILELLNLKRAAPLTGELEVRSRLDADSILHGAAPTKMLHRDVLSGGGIDTVAADPSAKGFEVCATVSDGSSERVFALFRRGSAARVAWARGSFSGTVTNAYLPKPDDSRRLFQAESLTRSMLSKFDYRLLVEKQTVETRNPLILVARSNNGFYFSGYSPSTAVKLRFRFPHGAPILLGHESWLESGHTTYSMPRAWHRECRVFVDQAEDGELACREATPEEIGIRRRMLVTGLKQATVHFYPERAPAGPPVRMENEGKRIEYAVEDKDRRLVARAVTGDLLVSW